MQTLIMFCKTNKQTNRKGNQLINNNCLTGAKRKDDSNITSQVELSHT